MHRFLKNPSLQPEKPPAVPPDPQFVLRQLDGIFVHLAKNIVIKGMDHETAQQYMANEVERLLKTPEELVPLMNGSAPFVSPGLMLRNLTEADEAETSRLGNK